MNTMIKYLNLVFLAILIFFSLRPCPLCVGEEHKQHDYLFIEDQAGQSSVDDKNNNELPSQTERENENNS